MRGPDSRTAENGEPPTLVAEDVSGVAAPFAGLRGDQGTCLSYWVSAPRTPVRLNKPLLLWILIRHALL
jgi:hypothetical protein